MANTPIAERLTTVFHQAIISSCAVLSRSMSQQIVVPPGVSRSEVCNSLLSQIRSLIQDEPDAIANVANIVAAVYQTMHFHWVGVYRVKNHELVLGPFQGPVACTRIGFGKGVCGTAWKENRTLIVPDVEKFPGHIACSHLSKSELVAPIRNKEGEVLGVLDIDSDKPDDFSSDDRVFFESLADIIGQFGSW